MNVYDDEPVPSAGAAAVDLYCLHCGYNLRGIDGDERRCSECGQFNRVGDMMVPAAMIRAELSRTETALALGAGCAAVILLAFLVGVAELIESGAIRGARPLIIAAPVAAALWMVALTRSQKTCDELADWKPVFVRYQILATVSLTCMALLPFGLRYPKLANWSFASRFLIAPGPILVTRY
jgi:hypothetical protein